MRFGAEDTPEVDAQRQDIPFRFPRATQGSTGIYGASPEIACVAGTDRAGCVRHIANDEEHLESEGVGVTPSTFPAPRATPDRGRVGRVAGGGGRAEASASRDRRRAGCPAP